MIYKTFKIKNFRGVDDVTIDLSNNRIITLVGLNESGKTSVMKGINWFYRMIKSDNPTENDLMSFRPKGTNFSGKIEISATLILEDSDKAKIKQYWKNVLAKRTQLEIGNEFTYRYVFTYEKHTYKETNRHATLEIKSSSAKKALSQSDNSNWQKIIGYIRENIVPEILYYDDFTLGTPETIPFEPTPTEDVLVNGKTVTRKNKIIETDLWKLAINDIMKSVDDTFNFQEDVVDMLESDPDAVTQRISEMESCLNHKITERWSELFGDNKVNFKEIKLDTKPNDDGGLDVSFKIKTKSNKVFNVNERSKGFQWFFSFLLFTEFRKRRTKNILFMLDEPASNLHSTAQAHILNAIEELSQDALVIYSTHSHHLINPKWLSGAYICINENQSNEVLQGGLDDKDGAKISSVKYFTYVGRGLASDKVSYFQPILDSLDYQPSLIEPIPDIVILEGKNDWYTFNYFKQILNSKKKINYYPGGGCDKLDDIIRLYLSWGKNFVVIVDGDPAGIKAQNRYKKTFDIEVENRIFTLKDVLNKAVETEDLIGVMDQKKIHDEIYGAGTYESLKKAGSNALKSNLNYAINHLQFGGKIVTMNAGTLSNFKKIEDFALLKLKENGAKE